MVVALFATIYASVVVVLSITIFASVVVALFATIYASVVADAFTTIFASVCRVCMAVFATPRFIATVFAVVLPVVVTQ